MAQLIVSCVADKLADLLIEESDFFQRRSNEDISDRISEVKVHLNRMQCSLKDAESKRKVDQVADEWISNVLNVTYKTEDAIDKFLIEINQARRYQPILVRRQQDASGIVRLLVASGIQIYNDPLELLASSRLGKRICWLQAIIRVIHENRSTFWTRNLGETGGEARPLVQPRVHPRIVNTEIVGFGDEEQSVVNALLSGYSSENLKVFSIVGPGGAGKTTLAQSVYNSEVVKCCFDFRIWLSISREFKPSNILKELCATITEASRKKVADDAEYQRRFMRDKKCLIVLDDVWTAEVIAHLAVGLRDVRPGSMVLITSRFLNIANLADSSSMQHKVQFLNMEKSLHLFIKKALPSRNILPESDELFPLAQELCERTGGLPLALVALGQLVSTKPPTYSSWLKVVDSFDWHSDGNQCMEILASSYEDLPDFLKACFRYFACFPKNHEIPSKYLSKLWIAEGFVVPKGMVALEDIAKDYLENLVQRFMVQVSEYSDGSIKSCRVHNVFHELAVYEAKKMDFLVIYGKEKTYNDLAATRRVAIHHHLDANNSIQRRTERMKIPSVRSLFTFSHNIPFPIRFMLVRVLELQGTKNLNSLPKEFQNMIHIKYLGLRSTNISSIPKTIGRLLNLQTLDIRDTKITSIPASLWKIKTLRHVHGSKPRNQLVVPDGPSPDAKLVKLQTLATFNVPKSWKKGLPHLPGLRKFALTYTTTEGPNSKPDWRIITRLLGNLRNLMSLVIHGEHIPSRILDASISPSYQNIKRISLHGHGSKLSLGTVELPPNLAKLTLVEVELDQDPMPKLAELPYLEVLQLRSVITVKAMDCPAKGFPELREFEIDNCSSLEEFKVHEESMPKLTNLIT